MPTTTQTPLSNFEDYEKKYGDLGAVKSFEDYEKKYAEKANVEKTDADSTNVGFGEKALNTLEALGHSATNLPTYAKGYLANVVEGTRPLDETNSLDTWAQEAQALSRKESESPEAAKPTLLGTKGDWESAIQSLPFSAGSMVGAVGGGAVGATTANPVGIYGGQALGAAIPAYRADSAMFMRDALAKYAEDYKQSHGGAEPPREALLSEQERLQPFAQKHGAAEAGFEAIGTPIANKLLGGIFKNGGNTAYKAARAAGGIALSEIPTETATQIAQHNVESQAGLTDEQERSFLSPSDIYQSGKEIIVPTIQQSLLLGGAGGLAKKGFDIYKGRQQPSDSEAPVSDSTPPSPTAIEEPDSVEASLERGSVGTSTEPDNVSASREPAAKPENPEADSGNALDIERVKAFTDRYKTWLDAGGMPERTVDGLRQAAKNAGVYDPQDESKPLTMFGKVYDAVYPQTPEERIDIAVQNATEKGLAENVGDSTALTARTLRAAYEAGATSDISDARNEEAKKIALEQSLEPQLPAQTPEQTPEQVPELSAPRISQEDTVKLDKLVNAIKAGKFKRNVKTHALIGILGERLGIQREPLENMLAYVERLTPIIEQEKQRHAQQIESPSATDVGGSAQSRVREESGNTAVGGEGVPSSGQKEGDIQLEPSETPVAQEELISDQGQNQAPQEGSSKTQAQEITDRDEARKHFEDVFFKAYGSAPATIQAERVENTADSLRYPEDKISAISDPSINSDAQVSVFTKEITPSGIEVQKEYVLPTLEQAHDFIADKKSNANQTQKAAPEEYPIDEAIAREHPLDENNHYKEAENPANNKKAVANFQDLPISIENPKGSKRSGVDDEGQKWERTLNDHYGEILSATGNDKDAVDVFIPKGLTRQQVDSADTVYVIDQKKPSEGYFDEHKVMLGYPNEESAKDAYKNNYSGDWQGLGAITPMPIEQFKQWLRSGDKTKPVNPTIPLAPEASLGTREREVIKYRDLFKGPAEKRFAEFLEKAKKTDAAEQYIRENAGELVNDALADLNALYDNSGEKSIDRELDQIYAAIKPLPKASIQPQQTVANAFVTEEDALWHLGQVFGDGINQLRKNGVLNFTQGKDSWPEAVRSYAVPGTEAAYLNGSAYIDLRAVDKTRLASVVLHEIGEHFNLRRMIGTKNYNSLQNQIANRAKIQGSKAQEAWESVKKDYGDLKEGGENFIAEVIARLGETAPNAPWYKRLLTQIKSFLIQHGLGRGFVTKTLDENDLHALLIASLQSAAKTQKARDVRTYAQKEPLLSRAPSTQLNQEEQFLSWSQQVKRKLEVMSDKLFSEKTALLSVQQLLEISQEYLPGMAPYERFRLGRTTEIERWWRQAQHVLDAAKKISKITNRQLGRVMQSSTLADVDASRDWAGIEAVDGGVRAYSQTKFNNARKAKLKASAEQLGAISIDSTSATFRDRSTAEEYLNTVTETAREQTDTRARGANGISYVDENPERAAEHAKLRRDLLALPVEAQKIYHDTHALHSDLFKAKLNALENNIKEGILEVSKQKQLIAQLRSWFESKSLAFYYAPLFRRGHYWFYGVRADGKNTPWFQSFESEKGRNAAVKEFKIRNGTDSVRGISKASNFMEGFGALGGSDAFVSKVNELIKDANIDSAVSAQLQDDIYQMYLATLPDVSMRHSSQHRKGTLGFETDWRMAFAHNIHHGASQIANMVYGRLMNRVISDNEAAIDMAAIPIRQQDAAADVKAYTELRDNWRSLILQNGIESEQDDAELSGNAARIAELERMQKVASAFNKTLPQDVSAEILKSISDAKRTGNQTEVQRLQRLLADVPKFIAAFKDKSIGNIERMLADANSAGDDIKVLQLKRLRDINAIYSLLAEENAIDALDHKRNELERILGYSKLITPEKSSKARTIVDEIKRTFHAMINTNSTPMDQAAAVARNLSYIYDLGFSLSGAAINLLQTPSVALPIASGKFGIAASTREFSVALSEWMGAFNNSFHKDSNGNYDNLDEDGNVSITTELKRKRDLARNSSPQRYAWYSDILEAMTIFKSDGSISGTQTHDVIGVGKEGEDYGGALLQFAKKSGWMFHHGERLNRETTLKAGYVLARKKGMAHDDAIEYARWLNNRSHLEYDPSNAARIFRGAPAAVALQFKKYSQGMLYNWGRLAYESLRNSTEHYKNMPEGPEKDALKDSISEARKSLGALFATQVAVAGAFGLPLEGTLKALLNALMPDDDDDVPFDAERALRVYLTKQFGEFWATFVTRGAFNALTPGNLASRMELSDIFFRDPPVEKEGRDAATQYLSDLFGPTGGVVQNIGDALHLIHDGEMGRAVERMLPKFLSDAVKARRFWEEDARTLAGEKLKDMRAVEIWLQASGVSSSDLEKRYAEKGFAKRTEQALQDKREGIKKEAVESVLSGKKLDPTAIREWNRKHRDWPITMAQLRASVKIKRKRERELKDRGYLVNPKLSYLYEDYALEDAED